MKILAIFIDMLGADYLQLVNPKQEMTKIDSFLKKHGGTLYTNCFTPAPDTPRSSACMWSGVYPKENHCNNRLKYPDRFMNPELENVWKILLAEGYTVNIFARKSAERIGLIPLSGKEHIFNDSIKDFMEGAIIEEKSFNFFYLEDLHTKLDHYDYTRNAFRKGCRFVEGFLSDIFEYYNATELFDYILMFSDHGFRMTDGSFHSRLLEYDRVKTFMYLWRKGDSILKSDNQLRSNLDIMPTICEMIGHKANPSIDGKSLLEKQGHEYILMEDHQSFSPSLGQTIEHWAVVSRDGSMHWLECSGEWTHQIDEKSFDEKFYENQIIEKMNDYEYNCQFYKTLSIYNNNPTIVKIFSDGTPYKLHKSAVWKFGKQVKKNFLHKWYGWVRKRNRAKQQKG